MPLILHRDDAQVLMLIDSRARSQTGKRTVYKFDPTQSGLISAWSIVLANEISDPEEVLSYSEIAKIDNEGQDEIVEACQVFNDYWAEYGWHLSLYDDKDTIISSDCVQGAQ